ncbi:hypothetical protein A2U01_0111162, partial [Trifolium medium]|nr:hypothetical protein [Trifolium medium]
MSLLRAGMRDVNVPVLMKQILNFLNQSGILMESWGWLVQD